MKRNKLTTPRDVLEKNLINHMRSNKIGINNPITMSSCGYAAFIGYKFLRTQGAAIAASKIVSDLCKRGILAHRAKSPRGYYLTQKGYDL